jgi:hypothetical protein
MAIPTEVFTARQRELFIMIKREKKKHKWYLLIGMLIGSILTWIGDMIIATFYLNI